MEHIKLAYSVLLFDHNIFITYTSSLLTFMQCHTVNKYHYKMVNSFTYFYHDLWEGAIILEVANYYEIEIK